MTLYYKPKGDISRLCHAMLDPFSLISHFSGKQHLWHSTSLCNVHLPIGMATISSKPFVVIRSAIFFEH
jgi:hypothetical protein